VAAALTVSGGVSFADRVTQRPPSRRPLTTGTPLEACARSAIGLHRGGAIMVTANLNAAKQLEWERWPVDELLTPAR